MTHNNEHLKLASYAPMRVFKFASFTIALRYIMHKNKKIKMVGHIPHFSSLPSKIFANPKSANFGV
jgi:hypothetical protein